MCSQRNPPSHSCGRTMLNMGRKRKDHRPQLSEKDYYLLPRDKAAAIYILIARTDVLRTTPPLVVTGTLCDVPVIHSEVQPRL